MNKEISKLIKYWKERCNEIKNEGFDNRSLRIIHNDFAIHINLLRLFKKFDNDSTETIEMHKIESELKQAIISSRAKHQKEVRNYRIELLGKILNPLKWFS